MARLAGGFQLATVVLLLVPFVLVAGVGIWFCRNSAANELLRQDVVEDSGLQHARETLVQSQERKR